MACLVRSVIFVLIVTGSAVQCRENFVPEASLEFMSPKGLKISLPGDNPKIKQVAFHININEEFYSLDHGQYAADIIKKRNGRWTWVIPDFRVKQGDIIYYWINIIEKSNYGYNVVDREYSVTQANPHGGDEEPNNVNPSTVPVQTTVQTPVCDNSPTSVRGRRSPVCQGEVLLDKHFDNLDGWNHQVTIGGSYLEDEFMVFTKDSSASWVENGKIVIKPMLLEEQYSATFVRSGQLFLEGCTSEIAEHCIRQAQHYLILPPIISSRLNTRDIFSFRYGTVEIKAKLPRGKWIVPELWLEPVYGPQTERVVIGLSRGNTDDSEFGWQTLEAGVLGKSQKSMGKTTLAIPWSQNFHTFKLHWAPDLMQFSVDDQEIHHISSADYPVMGKEVYITLGVHVAGSADFPDNIKGKPWNNTDPKPQVWTTYLSYIAETYRKFERFVKFWDDKSNWYPTWNQDSTLQVEYIKVTAL